MKFRKLVVQTRTVLHTITLQNVQRAHDSDHGYTEDDEHDHGFEFRWHRDHCSWFPDIGRLITGAMWSDKWKDERRLFPNRSEYDFFTLAMPRYPHHHVGIDMTVPRGGITFVKPTLTLVEDLSAPDQ